MRSRVPAPFRVIGRSIVDWWDGWLDMVVIIIIWLLAQFTVVFGPPATFGVYYVVHNMINGQAYGARGLVEGARIYFGKAWIWGILNLLVAITIYVNFIFYGAVEAGWGIYVQVFITLLTVLWLLTNFYALPFFMEQEKKSIRIALRNGFFTSLAAPFFSLPLFAMVLLVAGLSIVFVIPIFLGLPGLIPMMGVRAMYNRLETFGLRQPDKTPKEIEYEEGGKVNVPGRNLE